MIKQYLIQKQWFRDLTKRTYYLNNGKWKELSDFKKGEKVEDVYGKWNTKSWCDCGNELVHSESFLCEREVKETNMAVYDYECSFCGEKQHRNPCLMPGIHRCDEKGILIN